MTDGVPIALDGLESRDTRPALGAEEAPMLTVPWRPRDNHWRSAVKAASWRLTGSADTIVVSWIVTGHLTLALSIGGIEVFTKIVLYYLHERLWERLPFGRNTRREPEYYI